MSELPNIIGITKVRNEQHIIKDTLDNWQKICTGGIVVYDDVSDDKTVSICQSHPAVKEVIRGFFWDPNREKAEWVNRQAALRTAMNMADKATWFVYFDADEHIYNFDNYELFNNPRVKAIACRLYDYYITPEDVDKNYKDREWLGPEFRTINFFFKNSPYLKYNKPDQREVNLEPGIEIPIYGDIKHYGKCFSVEEWDKTCYYYIRHWPKYADKWRQRLGKAIKKDYKSDFGNDLIKWEDRHKGFRLEDMSYGRN